MERDQLKRSLKELLIGGLRLQDLRPDDIEDAAPIFVDGLGLDSVDALELVVALEKEFVLRIQSHEVGREAFASVAALAAYVEGRLSAVADPHAGS